jgi:hypothetical protein
VLLLVLRLLFVSWLCCLLRRLRPLVRLLYSLLVLRLLMRLLSLLPSRLVGSLLFHVLILPLLILLGALPLLILLLLYPLLLVLILLFMPVIPGHRRWMIRCRRSWRAIILLPLFLHPLLVLRMLTWVIGLVVVFRTLTWVIGLLVSRMLHIMPIAALVSGSAVGWRIVGAACLSGWHAVFEVSGPWSGCDRRPSVIHGGALLTIHSRELAMLSLIRYWREMSLTSEGLLLVRRPRGYAAVATIEADAIVVPVDHGGVVNIVNVGDVHVVY